MIENEHIIISKIVAHNSPTMIVRAGDIITIYIYIYNLHPMIARAA